jgi:tetratricopeptide (TPR) repeat protein
LKYNQDFVDAYYNLANALKEKGYLDEALIYYEKTIQLNPNFAHAYNNLGAIYQNNNKIDQALIYYQKAIALNPNHADAQYNLGNIFRDKNQFEQAIIHYEKAIQLNPSFAGAYNNLGSLYLDKLDSGKAISCFQKAIRINPNFAGAYNNLGTVYRNELEFDKAIHCFEKALQIEPNFIEAYNNLGLSLQEKNQLNESIHCFQKALLINPEFVEAHWNMSLSLLKSGSLEEGWQKYEWRLKNYNHLNCHQDFSLPLWDGSSLRRKTLFIATEQGIGDEIMFALCLSEVIAQAALCIIETDERLVPLLARSFPSATIIKRLDKRQPYPKDLPRADMTIAIGSLPQYLRKNVESFPKETVYLISDNEKTKFWRRRYKMLGDGLKVGISWHGGSKITEIRKRSLSLIQWQKLFSIQGIHFINLQYGDCIDELAEAKEKLGINIQHWDDANPLKDLDSFASQIRALDMVISIDNSTVHMAGALGVIVWTLLPFSCDWRWMKDVEYTPWYPTMRLFRQPAPGDWESVMTKVFEKLRRVKHNPES